MSEQTRSRSRRVNGITLGECLHVVVVRQSGGKGRFVVRADFDATEIDNILITVVPPDSVKSEVPAGISSSPTDK